MTRTDAPMLDRRDVIRGGAAAAGAALLPGTGFAQAAPRRGGTLRLAMPYNPAAVDPMTGRNLTDLNVLFAVFDPLIDFEPKTLALKPGLARAWTFTDPKTLVLDLVEGVKFHDGTDFDAEAVKFNLDRYKMDPRSNVKTDLVSVESVEATDKHKVTIRLNKPNSGLPAILSNRVGLMVSPKSVKDAPDGNIDRNAVGTGPFKFVSWQDNASFVLTRNDGYWRQGLPYLDGINIKIISELNTIVRAVVAGEADVGVNLQAPQKIIADRSKGVVATATPSLVCYGGYINYGRPPFDDVRVRQALNYGTNREEINKIAGAGLGQVSCAPLPREHWACDPATQNYYNYDPEKAKKLLAEAGHAGGLDIEAYGWADQLAMQRQEIVISQLAKVGFRVKLTPMAPQQAMQAFTIEKKGHMMFTPNSAFPDPSQLYEALFGAKALRNPSGIELPGFRELLDATTAAQDQAVRKEAFVKLQKFVVEQGLPVVHYLSTSINVLNPKVQNHQNNLLTVPRYTDVWLEA